MATTIEEAAAALRAQHQPLRVRAFTGSPTATARATEGQTRPAPVVAPTPAGKGGAVAPARPWADHPSTQPLPTDTRVFKSIAATGGRLVITVRPGKTAMRAAKAALGDALTKGVEGFPVRLVQSGNKGPVVVLQSDKPAVVDPVPSPTTIPPGKVD